MKQSPFPRSVARFVAPIVALLALAVAAAQAPAQPEATFARSEGKEAVATRFMVTAAHPLAVEAGYEVLREGGSAADAMIAVQLVLNLVEPQSSGIGGGAFLVYYDAETGSVTTLDARETAPLAAGEDLFLGPDGAPMDFWDAVIGGRSVGTPGVVRLLEEAHARYGRLEWVRLFEPAIALAEDGFEVSPRLADSVANARDLDRYEAARAYFFEDGAPVAAGETLRNPDFAQTLRTLAEGGADAFYTGPLAQAIVDAVQGVPDNPGLLEPQDLADYRVVERAPVCVDYRGLDVCGMGPPSSGALTVGQILGILNHFDLGGTGPTLDAAHLFAEASRLAYADRALYMADSDFVPMPTRGLVDPHYLMIRAQLIDPNLSMGTARAGNPPWDERVLYAPDRSHEMSGTSHISIVDESGNALSMTTTVETGFGSRVMVGGFLLNNELTDFSFAPEADGRPVANRVEPGKRPRSSMSPTIVLQEGRPFLVVGSPGGAAIIPYVAKTIIGVVDWNMTPSEAIELGHVTNFNGATSLEENTAAADYAEPLEARGHEVSVRNLNSGLHAILVSEAGLIGGADSRREGVVMGD